MQIARKIQIGNLVFAVVGGAVLLFTPLNHYGWMARAFPFVIIAVLLISAVVGIIENHRNGTGYLNGPEDLDRPGGPYDHLHGRR